MTARATSLDMAPSPAGDFAGRHVPHDSVQEGFARFDARLIDTIVAANFEPGHPGVAVGIAIDGVPVYRGAFGLANVELTSLLSPSTRMRIGSATKHFTALAFMLLSEEGAADLDDPIGRILPELHPATAGATIRTLITHTSGIRDIFDIGLTLSGVGKSVRSNQYCAEYRRIDSVDAEPGRRWSYNNGGYVLLTHAIERLTGQSLETVLRTRLFEPAGMHDTLLRRRDDDFLTNAATLHVADGLGGYTRDYMGMDLGGEGGVVSTVDDMLRWLRHMDQPVVGSLQTWAAMLRPHRLTNAASTEYGLGLMLRDYRGIATIAHPGTVFGGNAQMVKVPSAGVDVVVIANRSDVSAVAIAEAILDAVVPDLAPLPSSGPIAATGVFVGRNTGGLIQLRDKAETVPLSINGSESGVQVDEGGQRLMATSPGLQGSGILLPSDDAASALTLLTHGGSEPADRSACGGTCAGITGTYRLGAPAITLRIVDEGRRLESRGPFGATTLTLEQVADEIWIARAPGPHSIAAALTFSPDRDRMSLSTARTMRLNFCRIEDETDRLGDDE